MADEYADIRDDDRGWFYRGERMNSATFVEFPDSIEVIGVVDGRPVSYATRNRYADEALGGRR